jgi:hypothetical protein
MPASEINRLFKEGRLHSGSPEGPIVKNPRQALAIRLSYLRKEGKLDDEKPKSRMAELWSQNKK